MARLSFRDRFWSPRVARAVTSPRSILLAGAVAAVAIVATAPLSIPVLAAAAVGVVAGGAAYGGRVLLAVPRNPKRGSIDQFAVQEPWRRFVSESLAARRRFNEAVQAMRPGPLRSRLEEIGGSLDDAVDQIWAIARQGNSLQAARRQMDPDSPRRELAEIETRSPASDSPLARTAEALRAQIASANRLDAVISQATDQVRLLDARLDEAVTRAIEMSTETSSVQSAGEVGGEVDTVVSEMEALRLALDEADAAGSSGRGATATGSGSPGSSPASS